MSILWRANSFKKLKFDNILEFLDFPVQISEGSRTEQFITAGKG